MELMNREDFERYLFFETQREQAARDHATNKDDPQALLRWGGALLELAHFRQGQESVKSIEQAVEKFEAAIKLQESMHEAMWCLGNAFTSQGLLQPEASQADEFFTRAEQQFKKALALEPNNVSYKRAMEMIGKAPEIYTELQMQLQAQGHRAGAEAGPSSGASSSSSKAAAGGSKQKAAAGSSSSDWWYDVGGWVVLAGLIVSYVVAANRAAPPTPAGPTS